MNEPVIAANRNPLINGVQGIPRQARDDGKKQRSSKNRKI
jgi:hypothetical protein